MPLERSPSQRSFIGRERELAELDAGLSDTLSGRGLVFLLSGEPGIGKTRLAEEFSARATARSAAVVWGRSWDGDGAPPYWPLIQILRGCAAKPYFARHLKTLGAKAGEVVSIVPELRQALPSTPVQAPASPALDPDGARFRLFDAVTTLLASLALDQPLVLVIDDLHDAGEASLRMLSFAARGLKDSAVLMLGTYRDAEVKLSPELSKSIGALSRHGSTIPLGGLSEAEVAELVEAKAGRPADRSLVKRLYQTTDGNPLFVDGVVKLMLADGNIDQTRGADCDFKIPDGVRESIRQRLAALSERPYSILVTAAVIGNEFDVGLLQSVSGRKPEELVDLLKEAVDLGIVTNGERLGGSYRFSHALIRGAIYEGLAAAERARVHRRIGDAVEELYGTDENAHLDQLAYHFSQAPTPETVDKAINYSIRAGEAASQRYAYDRAGSYWRAALGMMSLANANPTRRAKVLGYLGSELFSAGPEAIAYLEEALPLFESLNKTCALADIHLRLGNLLLSPHLGYMDVRRAMEHLGKAEALPTDQAQLPFLYYLKGLACWRTLEIARGFELNRRAMELSEQRGDEFFWIHTAMMNTIFLVALGHLAEAHALELRAREKAERLEDAYSGSFVAWTGGNNSLVLLDPCTALSKFLAELLRPRTSRSRIRSAPLLEGSSTAYAAIGERAESRRVRAQLRGVDSPADMPRGYKDFDSEYAGFLAKIARARSIGNREAVCNLARMLGESCRTRGMFKESEALLRESLDIASNAPHFPLALLTELNLCVLYFDMCRRDDAHRCLAHCRSMLAPGEDWKGIGGLAARAEALLSALDQEFKNADAQFEKALDNFRQYRLVWLEADTYYDWGRVLITAGDPLRAGEKFDTAVEIYRRIGAGQRWIERVEEARSAGCTVSLDRTQRERPGTEPFSISAGVTKGSELPNVSIATSCNFQREGDFWTISYRDRTFRLKDMKGLYYIAHLLAHPGEQFHVHDLVAVVDRATQADETSPQDISLRVANDLGDAGTILDSRAKAEYRSRRVELRGELAEAEAANDGGRSERIREELEMLEEQLAAAVGLGGRDRKAADHAERTRSRVGRAIRNSLRSIRENDPSLGHHLETCIHTGYLCAYRPGPEVSLAWRV